MLSGTDFAKYYGCQPRLVNFVRNSHLEENEQKKLGRMMVNLFPAQPYVTWYDCLICTGYWDDCW